MADLGTLFHDHAAGAFERQLRLAEVLDGRAWQFDKDAGTLTFAKKGFFGKPLVVPVQVLGTESESANTWLWSWANAASKLPEVLTRVARNLRALGEREGIVQLVEPEVSLEEMGGDQIALVASGVAGAAGYYRCPYPGGAMYTLLSDRALLPPLAHPVVRTLSVFPQAIDAIDFDDPRGAFRGLLRELGFSVVESGGGAIAGMLPGKGDVLARFDDDGRFVEITGNARP